MRKSHAEFAVLPLLFLCSLCPGLSWAGQNGVAEPPASGSQIAAGATGEWEGIAEITADDDFEHGKSDTIVRLNSVGRQLRVSFAGPRPQIKSGDMIRARGVLLGESILAAGATPVQEASTAGCSPVGPQSVAVLLINLPGAPLPSSITPSLVRDFFFSGGTNSLDDYWREASYGQTSASGSVFGPFNISQALTCDQIYNILDAAITATDSTVDFTAYKRVFIIMPNKGTCSVGYGSVGCWNRSSPSHGSFTSSFAWLRADYLTSAARGVQMAAHEGGHGLGLEHAGSLQFGTNPLGPPGDPGTDDKYGDFFSMMGVAFTYGSTQLIGHYAAPHKSQLGWFAQSNVQSVQAPGTFVVAPYETAATGLQALRVERAPGSNQHLWIEYRQPIGYDSTFQAYTTQPYTGALIHLEDANIPAYAGETKLLDFTAATTPGQFSDAALAAGSTWSDSYTLLSLTANSATPAGLSVTVKQDLPCAVISPVSAIHSASAETGAITVSGSCTSVAATTTNWITITGGSTINGAGTVTYAVEANTTANARAGTIYVARQAFTVTQAGVGSSPPPSVNPGGIVNAASFAPGAPVAPGSIAAAFGSFPFVPPTGTTALPLPTNLSGVSLRFGGYLGTPLFFVSEGQVNLQVPWELAGQAQTTVTAGTGGQTSAAQAVNLAPFAPGIFSLNSQGTGQGAVQDAGFRLVDSSNPVATGDVILIYSTGLGPVTNQPPSGWPAPLSPLAETTTKPAVSIGGGPAVVTWAGLTPTTVGLYQVQALVPAAALRGAAVPVTLSIGGVTSNTVTIAVR